MRPLAAFLVMLTALAAAACASAGGAAGAGSSAYGASWAAVPGARSVADLGLRPDLADLALTIYPTPRRAEYGDVLLPLDDVRRADESAEDADRLLRAAGLEIGFRELPDEGYVLAVSSEGSRTVVLAAARDEAGRRWAACAVEQVTTEIAGRRYIRACRILDAPVFPLRGSKRPQAWEEAYRANFAWEAKLLPEHRGRELVATTAPGSPLDATPEGVARILEEWRPWQERGVRRFCVKFDDVGFEMTPPTRLRHGTYPVALRSLVGALRAGLRERDPHAVLYLLPQTYWWNDRRMAPYARALRETGGLEPDVGLVLTGPEIVSDSIDVAGLAATREIFGSVETAALLYDNLGREGDWGPLTGRDPALSSMCDGVFGERGTPVNRLTRLDWLWNPAAYDAEHSWRRAVFELAGPEGYYALASACTAFRRGAAREEAASLVDRFAAAPGASYAGPLPRERIVRLLRDDLSRLEPGPAATTSR
jgi:hypothetical protein